MPDDVLDQPGFADGMDPATSTRAVVPLKTCAGCGESLVRLGPNGECLRCLLGIDLSADGGLLIDAVIPVERGRVQLLSFGHFDLVVGSDGAPVELGSGAMATTYRAHDTVLHCAVALKVIDTNVAANPAARKRFLREARAAAKLRHANVAGVSHYGEQEGECYYAMELVEGETLEARVRREGPLPPAIALEVGVQIARALEAAEACGVVHRDLKPSNVMLAARHRHGGGSDDPPVVKVIDWGLAKAVNADPILGADQTRDGFVGTPAFASPEQFAPREDRRVDTRSDIYSLGVTLWYLLCGRTPFVGGTLEAIHAQQQEPPFELLVAARVPRCMVGVLKRMLALDPAARPQSPSELHETLRRCQEQFIAEERWITRCNRYRWLAATLGTLAVLGIGAGAWRHSSRAMTVAIDGSVAVLPFDNLSPDKADAPFTVGLQDEIAKNLARVAALRVVGVNGTRSDARQTGDLPPIGQELGVRHLLTGSVRRQEGQVHVRLRLQDVENPNHSWSAQYDRPLTDAFVVRSEITQAVAAHLGVTLSAAEQAAVAEPPTRDLTAYDIYLRVHEETGLFQSDTERVRYYSQVAVPSLKAALARDPKFVLAYCDLAAVYDFILDDQGTVTRAEAVVKGHRQAEAMLAVARQLQPDNGEMHLAQARHFGLASRDREQAQIELARARRTLPDNVEVESLAGELAYNENRWDEATRRFERAAILDPHNNSIRVSLINLYQSLRRYDDVDRELAQILASMAPEDSLMFRLGRTIGPLEARADLSPLRAAIRAVTPAEQPQEEVMNRYGLTLALCAHDPAAVSDLLDRTTQPNIVIRGIGFPKSWFAALAARMRQDEAGAQAAFRLARVEVDRGWQTDPMNGRILGLLAMIDAGLGHRGEAVREALHACELCPVEAASDQAPVVACDLAVVYAWTGQPDLSCAVLEEWIKRPAGFALPDQPTYGDFQLNPVWDSLRGYPRFEALVLQLAPSKDR